MALASSLGIADSRVWILEQIIKAREVLITALLELCSKLVDRYHTTKPSCRFVDGRTITSRGAEIAKECDTIVYGSLVRGLEPIGIWPSAVTSSNTRMSALGMMSSLQRIRCYALREPQNIGFNHSVCDINTELEMGVSRVMEHFLPLAMDVAIDESYRKHMEEQARK